LTRLRTLIRDASPAALTLACAVPFVFLHPHYQVHLAFGQVDVDLSDLAILAAVVAAALSGLRAGFGPLRAGRNVWLASAGFLVLILVSIAWAKAADSGYSISTNLVSALKFVEYAFLAPAVPLALRRPGDRRAFYWAVAAWSIVVTAVAALQFLGVLDQFRGHDPLDREPSILGEHDFAAFSGGALGFGFAWILLRRERALGVVGTATGGLGLALAAAIDSVTGMWASAIVLAAVGRRTGNGTVRRLGALAAVAIVVTVAAFSLRGHAVGAFMRFLGIRPNTHASSGNVQTWSQRVVLGYIGVEIFLHHPLAGVGWQESKRPHAFDPFLAGAREHWGKSQPPESFPSPQHMWGVQDGIIQTAADLGAIGLALLVAIGWSTARLAIGVGRRAPPELLFELLAVCTWLIVGIAVFAGSGLLPGLTVDAQLWLGLGLVVALDSSRTRTG